MIGVVFRSETENVTDYSLLPRCNRYFTVPEICRGLLFESMIRGLMPPVVIALYYPLRSEYRCMILEPDPVSTIEVKVLFT